jgi:hypothetical protein
MDKTHHERLEIELDNIRQLGETARARLNFSDTHPGFQMGQFNHLSRTLSEEVYPRIESLLGEIEDLKNESGMGRKAAATERAAALSDRTAAAAELAAAKNERAAAEALVANLQKIPPPTTDRDFQLAAQAILADEATKEKEDAILERNKALEQLQQLQARHNNDMEQRQYDLGKLENELRAKEALGLSLQEDLASANDEVRELKRKLADQDSSTQSTRRTAREAGLSSPEPGQRAPAKRPSLPGPSGIPLPSRTVSLSNSNSLDITTPAIDRRTGVATRKSGGRTSFERMEHGDTPSEKTKRTRFDIEASYNLLVLPANWDDKKRATFKQQYSAIKGNEPRAQVDLLNKSSIRTCLIASLEKQKARRGMDIPIDTKAQCPSCNSKNTKTPKGRLCVYLENISDPDEDTQKFQVNERPEK